MSRGGKRKVLFVSGKIYLLLHRPHVRIAAKGARNVNNDLMRQRLVEARQGIGCNRKEFAEMLGIPYRTITNYENGQREPGGDYMVTVADACGVTVDWLVGRSNEKTGVAPATPAPAPASPGDRLAIACRALNPAAVERVIAYAQDLAWNPANKKDPA